MAPLVLPVDLGHGVGAAVTGRDVGATSPPIGAAGNTSHRRPHRPDDLAATRRHVGTRTGTDVRAWHLMRQVHGDDVAVVDARTPVGAELDGVDAAVTAEVDRPLGVHTADCVPVLLRADGAVGVAHAGRVGFAAGVVPAVVDALTALASGPRSSVRAVVGPAIGGCCYEVPAAMRDDVGAAAPRAVATTTWGAPALDLAAGVEAQLVDAGVVDVERVGGCTACDPEGRWFSHRRDPDAGRQLGLVVLRTPRGAA